MRTFEYKFVHSARANDIIGALNKAGAEGWEGFAAMDVGHDYSILLKRPTGSDNAVQVINTDVGQLLHVPIPPGEGIVINADSAAAQRHDLRVSTGGPDYNDRPLNRPHPRLVALSERETLYDPRG